MFWFGCNCVGFGVSHPLRVAARTRLRRQHTVELQEAQASSGGAWAVRDIRLRGLHQCWPVVVAKLSAVLASVMPRRSTRTARPVTWPINNQSRVPACLFALWVPHVATSSVCCAAEQGMRAERIIRVAEIWGQKCWNSAVKATSQWCIAPPSDSSTTPKLSTATFKWVFLGTFFYLFFFW